MAGRGGRAGGWLVVAALLWAAPALAEEGDDEASWILARPESRLPHPLVDCQPFLPDVLLPHQPPPYAAVPDEVGVAVLERLLREHNADYDRPRVVDGVAFPSFAGIAETYREQGDHYGIRWDLAFIQMILETNYLRFTGTVPPGHYNFAGIDAREGHLEGEAFAGIEAGVRAHVQHLALYALMDIPPGELEAQRSRTVRELIHGNVCRQLQQPAAFDDLGPDVTGDKITWAAGDRSRGYGEHLREILGRILPDPNAPDFTDYNSPPIMTLDRCDFFSEDEDCPPE